MCAATAAAMRYRPSTCQSDLSEPSDAALVDHAAQPALQAHTHTLSNCVTVTPSSCSEAGVGGDHASKRTSERAAEDGIQRVAFQPSKESVEHRRERRRR